MSSQADMGIRAFKEGRIAEAIVFLEYATKFTPDDHQVWLMLARAYQRDGQAGKAVEAYKFVLDNTHDTRLTSFAREGLSSIDDRRALAAVQTVVARPKCPECGLEIPESRIASPWCNCGWNQKTQVQLTNRVFIADIQAYCRRKSVRMSIMFRGDVIVIGASEVRIQGIGTRTYPVNPRLLFNTVHGMLCVDKPELDKVMAKVSDDALFRERNASDDLTVGKLYNWPQFLARLSEFRGYDVSATPPDTSLAGVLASYNALDQELINDALELREDGETLGQTILRLGISNFEAMVTAVVGDFRVAKPGARPFHERLGSVLLAKGIITPVQLQEALGMQPQLKRPLGEILVSQLKACTAQDLQAALKSQRALNVMLPEADMLGELLVARKKLTRTDMLQALADEQTKRRVPLGEVLINMGLINHQDLQGVLGWQSQKKRVIQVGLVRLGEVLTSQGVINPAQLSEALKLQVLDPRPLGQILVSKGYCTPEQLLSALESQIGKRNQMAGSEGAIEEAGISTSVRRSTPTTPLRAQTGKLNGTAPMVRKGAPKKQAEGPNKALIAGVAIVVAAVLGLGAKFMLTPKAPPASQAATHHAKHK